MEKLMIVGGDWSFRESEARPSKIVAKIAERLSPDFLFNGGKFSGLPDITSTYAPQAKVVLWMPNIPNEAPKLISNVKLVNPFALLIESKNVIGRSDLEPLDIVDHVLRNKANLCIVISKCQMTDRLGFTLIDPLGNIFCSTQDIDQLCFILEKRVGQLLETRRSSILATDFDLATLSRELDNRFLDIIHEHAHIFEQAICRENSRFLGNASFRCMRGFPSVKIGDDEGTIFVTRRNVDKKTLNSGDFVPIRKIGGSWKRHKIFDKPSVDAPVQVALYDLYPNIRYMFHSHVYVEGAPYTKGLYPCGDLREIEAIQNMIPDPRTKEAVVNLRGHGFLIMTDNLDFLENQKFIPKEIAPVEDW